MSEVAYKGAQYQARAVLERRESWRLKRHGQCLRVSDDFSLFEPKPVRHTLCLCLVGLEVTEALVFRSPAQALERRGLFLDPREAVMPSSIRTIPGVLTEGPDRFEAIVLTDMKREREATS